MKHILITGHTGFKGAWLTFLLKELGLEVSGVSLPARPTSIYANSNLGKFLKKELFMDIRDYQSVSDFVKEIRPDAIIHLAAQPLVRKSYSEPIYTYETNFNGTLNLLEISKKYEVESTLIITTDKVYRDENKKDGYVETDSLGGFDPYSNSKALADLLTQSYISTNLGTKFGIARAGNVIGGGDDGEERLLPDIFRAIEAKKPIKLRNAHAIRPWQYVLDCLYGYFLALNNLSHANIPIWNFGPNNHYTVMDFVSAFSKTFGTEIKIERSTDVDFKKESELLMLNSNKAKTELNWSPIFDFEGTLESTIEWYFDSKKTDIFTSSMKQISKFLTLINNKI